MTGQVQVGVVEFWTDAEWDRLDDWERPGDAARVVGRLPEHPGEIEDIRDELEQERTIREFMGGIRP